MEQHCTAGMHLLASPQGPWLDDGGHGDGAVPVLQPHEQVHHDVRLYEGVTLGHQA